MRFSRASDEWRLEVSDPGVGGDWVPGTGLNSIRERSEAVGGRLVAGEGRVAVTLPLRSG